MTSTSTSYNDILTQLDKMEEDIVAQKNEVIKRQEEAKKGLLSNIKEAREILAFINEQTSTTKNEEILNEFDKLKLTLEEVIETSEQALKEYC